ncbi:MAG: hypothetical protein EOP04_29950 [Proteobacteria bacterium]|nr:MAG: hypothetical protein EOP04_29950 [Pseudomonadota bacterium]
MSGIISEEGLFKSRFVAMQNLKPMGIERVKLWLSNGAISDLMFDCGRDHYELFRSLVDDDCVWYVTVGIFESFSEIMANKKNALGLTKAQYDMAIEAFIDLVSSHGSTPDSVPFLTSVDAHRKFTKPILSVHDILSDIELDDFTRYEFWIHGNDEPIEPSSWIDQRSLISCSLKDLSLLMRKYTDTKCTKLLRKKVSRR